MNRTTRKRRATQARAATAARQDRKRDRRLVGRLFCARVPSDTEALFVGTRTLEAVRRVVQEAPPAGRPWALKTFGGIDLITAPSWMDCDRNGPIAWPLRHPYRPPANSMILQIDPS